MTAALLMMLAGLRRGEVIALRWDDVNFAEKTITINKAAEIVNGKFVVKQQTKTKAGNRTIPLPETLVSYLRQQEKQSVFICPSATGKLHTLVSWRRMWQSYLHTLNAKYGVSIKSRYKQPLTIPRISPHWLRHTYATNLYLSGVDILTAKTLLGHADIETTMTIYTHLNEEHKKNEIEKLNKFLMGVK